MKSWNVRRVLALAIGMLALAGCTKYHKVTDSATGNVYYTTNWNLHQYGNSTAVRLRANDGKLYHLDDAHVEEILEAEYTTGTPN